MKTRIAIIILLALGLIGMVIAEQLYVADTLKYMQTETEQIKTTIFENNDINSTFLIEKINALDENWKQRESMLCFIVNHKDMEKVGEQIEKLKVLISQNKKEEAEYEAQLLVYYVDGYEHFVAVTFQNIF